MGTLHLPPIYASAWIIDGQHRLYGYAYARGTPAFNLDSTVLPVLAYENLPADKEMNLFIDINSKQVKVSPGLLVELYADLHWCSSDPEEAFQALLSRIASRLNSESTSPLHDRMVVTGKKKTQYRCLTQTSVRDGLSVAKLLGTLSRGAIVPGPLSTGKADDYDANLRKGLSVLSECLRMFSAELTTTGSSAMVPEDICARITASGLCFTLSKTLLTIFGKKTAPTFISSMPMRPSRKSNRIFRS